MLRTILIAAAISYSAGAFAGSTATCDRLDGELRGTEIELHDSNISVVGDDLVLRSGGAELIHIDAERQLFVSGRPVTVPAEARPHLDAYVVGFRRFGDEAAAIGTEGGKIAAKAVTGLVEVLFTSATVEDYERDMERRGEAIEARAERLCRTIAELQRTERALQQRIPAFPTFIAPVNPAL